MAVAAESGRHDRLRSPWEDRLAGVVGGSPLRLASVVVGGLLGLHFAVQALLGWPTLGDETGAGPISAATRSATVLSLLIAYALSAPRFVARLDRRDLRGAGYPHAGPDDYEMPPPSAPSMRAARLAGAGGAAVGVAIVLAFAVSGPDVGVGDLFQWAAWRTPWLSTWVLSALLCAIVARGLCFMAFTSSEVRTAVREDLPIDLLNLRPLAVAGRMALRGSLLWLGGLSIALLFFVGVPASIGLAGFGVGIVVLAMAALVLPVLGLRERIRSARQAALEETEESLRAMRDLEHGGGTPPPGRLADLLAYRAYLEALSDWPWDARTRSRFLLYALIPLGSWIGGALVERALGHWLG